MTVVAQSSLGEVFVNASAYEIRADAGTLVPSGDVVYYTDGDKYGASGWHKPSKEYINLPLNEQIIKLFDYCPFYQVRRQLFMLVSSLPHPGE